MTSISGCCMMAKLEILRRSGITMSLPEPLQSMNRIVRQTLLYDFYGMLLTEHQQKAYEAVVMEDLSYAELARLENISRQGAYDMIRRCDRQLEEYERQLQLVSRFLNMKEELRKIGEDAELVRNQLAEPDQYPDGKPDQILERIISRCDRLRETL